jgi:hypothetical protein
MGLEYYFPAAETSIELSRSPSLIGRRDWIVLTGRQAVPGRSRLAGDGPPDVLMSAGGVGSAGGLDGRSGAAAHGRAAVSVPLR